MTSIPTHFLNLTNGLEWADDVPNPDVIRIESTAIEKDDWWRVMRDLDATFLLSVALGQTCHVYDCGTRRKTSKTISVGVPRIVTILKSIWDGKCPDARTEVARQCLRRLKYFRRYFSGRVDIIGHSRRTEHDGDTAYYTSIASRLVRAGGIADGLHR